MALNLTEIEEQALRLPEAERAQLADMLLQTLVDPMPPDVAADWIDELRRRLDAYERGESIPIDAAEAIERAREIAG
jgi:hypothetical protein